MDVCDSSTICRNVFNHRYYFSLFLFSYLPGADFILGLGRTKRDLSGVDFMGLHDKVGCFLIKLE